MIVGKESASCLGIPYHICEPDTHLMQDLFQATPNHSLLFQSQPSTCQREGQIFIWFSKIAQCDVSVVHSRPTGCECKIHKMQRDENRSCPYLMMWDWVLCHLVGKVVLGAVKMPQFVDPTYVLFQVTPNLHSHIFQYQPSTCHHLCWSPK